MHWLCTKNSTFTSLLLRFLKSNHLTITVPLQRKARQGNDSTAASENECEVDLEQFMTVDSIGDVDDQNDNEDELSERKEETSAPEDVKPKVEINVGSEHVKKVEVFYCELCRFYLPSNDDQTVALAKHCGSRSHLRSYLRYKENQNLRLAAEKIHRRQERQEREAKKEKTAGIRFVVYKSVSRESNANRLITPS